MNFCKIRQTTGELYYVKAIEGALMCTDEHDEIPTRPSLLSRLRESGEDEDWKVFFETYWRLIYNTARRAGLSDAAAQDVVQLTVISVLKSLPSFTYAREKGRFKGWLLTITWRQMSNFLRGEKKATRLIADDIQSRSFETLQDGVEDPNNGGLDRIWNEEWERNLLEAAFQRLEKHMSLKDYQVFDLCLRDWETRDICKTLNISRMRLYSIRHRGKKLLKHEIQELRKNPI